MTSDTPDQQAFEAAHGLWREGRHAEAAGILANLSQRYPDNPDLFSALGVCLFEGAQYGPARQALEKALSLDPGQGIAAYNLAHLLLLLGEEERGFQLYEQRWSSFQRPSWHPDASLTWNGEAFEGALLVLAEQGFGDMIQFARFLPEAAKRCSRLVLAAPAELKRLLAAVPGVSAIVSNGEALPQFDRFVMMMSLPLRLGMMGDAKPKAPYLPLPKAADLPGRGVKVGLVWAGRTSHAEDRLRSLSSGSMAPILAVPGVDFFSLQLGDAPPPKGVTDLSGRIADFQDTASLIAGLDLLISADTAPAHLAGAMGKPVWTFVTYVPDWRWGLGGEATPWYPSMRLFRQDAPGDWSGAVARAAKALAGF